MKTSRLILLSLLVILVVLLGACTGVSLNASWPGLSADDTLAYLADGSHMYAVRIEDGSEAWRFPAKPDGAKTFHFAPVKTLDNLLVAGDYSGSLYGIDPQNPQSAKWTFTQGKGRYVGSPLATKTLIYVPAGDNNLYALDAQGSFKWKFTTKKILWSAPVTDGQSLYLAAMDHFLYALDPASGAKIWSVDLGGALVSSPLLTPDGLVIVGTMGSEVVAVNSTSGKVAWRKSTVSSVWNTPVLKDKTLYVGDLSGTIFALNAANGAEVWKIKPGDAIIASPALTPNGLIFVVETGAVISVDFEGKFKTINTIKGKLYTTPVYVNERILVAVKGGDGGMLLTAMDTEGKDVWSTPYVPAK
jgi:outer membrane protein assembly factor BamB